jgi:hypothetical protein
LRAARAPAVAQELSNVDDYQQTGAVDDLGRGDPGPLRTSQRGGFPSP